MHLRCCGCCWIGASLAGWRAAALARPPACTQMANHSTQATRYSFLFYDLDDGPLVFEFPPAEEGGFW